MSTQIMLARVDKRLLHATVALNWHQFMNFDSVIVVDPTYVGDPFIEKVLQLSLPKTMKVKILGIEQLIKYVDEETESIRNVMIVFKDIETAWSAVDAGLNLKEIQLPYPASRILMKKIDDYYTTEEVMTMRLIVEHGIDLYFQTAPTDSKDYSAFKALKED